MADAPNRPTEKPGQDGRGVIRWAAVVEAATGGPPPGHHHEEKPGVHEDSLRAGHEPDKYDARGIVMVPVLVVAVTAVTYAIITATFSYIRPGETVIDPNGQPLAAANAKMGYNERAAAIDSTVLTAPVYQPRLEGVKVLDTARPANPGGDPVYVRSFKPTDTVENSPELTPQDLYPNRYVDHATGKKVLAEAEWLDKGKGVARIPIADAMRAVVGHLPAKADAKPNLSTADTPKISNGGQVTAEGPVRPADAPHGHEHKAGEKHDDHKDEKKPDAPKAGEKK
jgi:hypothetical protein